DQLADQRVVVRRYLVAAVQVRVDPHTVAARCVEDADRTRAGQEAGRVFGVDPAFDGMAANHHVLLLQAQRQTATHLDLVLDDIDTGDHFGNRVLHLDPGVHLDEEELAILVEKLEGAGTAITQIDTGLYAAGLNFCAGLLVDARRGGLFDDLLVAALQGAVAVAQMDGIALAIRQHLDFNVTRVGQVFFQVDHRVAEGSTGFGAGQADRLDQILFLVHHAHAATTTATGGLDDHRIADAAADLQAFLFIVGQWAVGAGDCRYTGLLHGFDGRHLVA